MAILPFTLTQCSWPRPVLRHGNEWVSEPEWDALVMPTLPQPNFQRVDGKPCWLIDWSAFFCAGLRRHDGPFAGEMRGFHVVFHLQVNASGLLTFWADDGCIIRRDGTIVHSDRSTHPLADETLAVEAGDLLEVAHWQNSGEWQWGAWLDLSVETLRPSLEFVQRKLGSSNGPPLKLYFGDGAPLRAVVATYSMILNGYRPSDVFVFGDYQWSPATRLLVSELLPFANIVPTDDVLRHLNELGQSGLAKLALNCWGAMKLAVTLLYPPDEYCFMDDDVFVLDSVDDALQAFRECNLVLAPDADYSAAYIATWRPDSRDCIGQINTGLYWLRNQQARHEIASSLVRVSPSRVPVWQWEQGFLATRYARETHCQLPSQRYFYPYFDGLPGGILGYDYAANPCGFATIHFGGLAEKPDDMAALALAPSLLRRKTLELFEEANPIA
jgi:hypothetical protein